MLTTYRYGSPRSRDELLRIGVTRQVPRGVRREDWQRLGYFDVWMPTLAPSKELVAEYQHGGMTFAEFSRHYKTSMKGREQRHVIELLAAMLPFCPVSIGCFCEDESRCHRSILHGLIEDEAKERGLSFSREGYSESGEQFASPVCYAHLKELGS